MANLRRHRGSIDPVRWAVRLGHGLIRAYPRSLTHLSAETRLFVAEAMRDAWCRNRWRGLARELLLLIRDVASTRWRGRAPDLTARPGAFLRATGDVHARTWSYAMEQLRQDIRYTLRRLAHARSFTAVALVTLALGIGLPTAVFTVVDDSMLRPFPYPDMARIMVVRETAPQGRPLSVSWPDFQDWRNEDSPFQELGLYRGAAVNLTTGETPARVSASVMSSSVFETIGIAPLLGQVFTRDDDRPGARHRVVISERLWRDRLGARADILGTSLVLDDEPYTVIGVMPAAMRFPSRLTDAWLPFGSIVERLPKGRDNHPGLVAVGRLKPGISISAAQTAMSLVAQRLEHAYPDTNQGVGIAVRSYYEQIVQDVRPTFQAVLGAVALVLLITCANLANLMLVRTESRTRELALRAALGAGRRRLAQSLLVEAGTIAVIGGALGVAVAFAAVRAFVATRPTTIPRVDLIHIDARALAFAAAVSMLSGLLFGLAPALRHSLADVQQALRAGRTSAGRAARRLRDGLVIAEVAIAIVLLVGAGLLARTMQQLGTIDVGFEPDHVVTMQMMLPPASYRTTAAWAEFHRAILMRVSALPGADAAGLTSNLPLSGNAMESMIIREGEAPPAHGQPGQTCSFQAVSADYFRTLGIRLVRGRPFGEHDTDRAAPVAIVDDTLASAYFGGADPIGRRISFESTGESPADFHPIWREIVGVVHHVKSYGVTVEPPYLQVFTPYTQLPLWMQERRPALSLAIRTAGDPTTLVSAVRQAVVGVDPKIPVYGVAAMSESVDQATEQPRLSLALFGVFAGLALVLAAVGVYGVLAYAVEQRTREIGVRIALGAGRADVARLVGRSSLLLVGVGGVIGVAGALTLSRYLSALLFNVSPTDPWTFAIVLGILGASAALATFIPARRAARVDPLVALRSE